MKLGGPQLQHRSVPGFTPEQIPAGATFSKFTPPANTGLGFLDAVSDSDILLFSDPNDLNGDGILDLLYAPLNGFSLSDSQQLQWQTYLGDSIYDASVIATPLSISDRLGSTLIHTWSGNDQIADVGSTGKSTLINTGSGIDTVVYSGASDKYHFAATESGWRVTGGTTPAVNDTLTGVERLRFADKFVAIDLEGNAGEVAKTLGAVFGKDYIANKEYVGIGLYYTDSLHYSYSDLMQLAINARLGPNPSNAQVVDLLYTHVVGTAPDASTRKSFTDLLENHTYTVASLGIMAAETALNQANINLVGLQQSGLAYEPFGG